MAKRRTTYNKVERTCAHCQKTFLGTMKAKYCSRSHNVLATRKKTTWQELIDLRTENTRLQQQISELLSRSQKATPMPDVTPASVPQKATSTPTRPPADMPTQVTTEEYSPALQKAIEKMSDDGIWKKISASGGQILKEKLRKEVNFDQFIASIRVGKTAYVSDQRYQSEGVIRFWLHLDGKAVGCEYERKN